MKSRLNSLTALLAPKAVYGGWYSRQRPRDAIKAVIGHVFVAAVVIYLAFLFVKIAALIVHALIALAFGVPFEFPTAVFQLSSS